jgi:hypothetical protein
MERNIIAGFERLIFILVLSKITTIAAAVAASEYQLPFH